jgi:hypothetical protein
MPKKCPHNREQYRCRDCGGFGMCVHGREKRRCKECDMLNGVVSKRRRTGAGKVEKKVYEMKINRESTPNKESLAETQDAGISEYDAFMIKKQRRTKLCVHRNPARNCRLCPGPNVCEHQRYRYSCKQCRCEHGIYHMKCTVCKAPWTVEHQLDGTEIDTSILFSGEIIPAF